MRWKKKIYHWRLGLELHIQSALAPYINIVHGPGPRNNMEFFSAAPCREPVRLQIDFRGGMRAWWGGEGTSRAGHSFSDLETDRVYIDPQTENQHIPAERTTFSIHFLTSNSNRRMSPATILLYILILTRSRSMHKLCIRAHSAQRPRRHARHHVGKLD
jgi:hypothetical protein